MPLLGLLISLLPEVIADVKLVADLIAHVQAGGEPTADQMAALTALLTQRGIAESRWQVPPKA